MNLLEYAIETKKELETISIDKFAEYFCNRKMESFYLYNLCDTCKQSKEESGKTKECYICNNGLIPGSHGLSFWDNIISYWDNPRKFYVQDLKEAKKLKNKFFDYEENFVRLIEMNKSR